MNSHTAFYLLCIFYLLSCEKSDDNLGKSCPEENHSQKVITSKEEDKELIQIIEIDNQGRESFNLIQNTMNKYKNAVKEGKKHFKFIVKNSPARYNENHIEGLQYHGKKHDVVELTGESKEGVIIYTDGNSNNSNFKTPSDYDFSDQRNKVLKSIPANKKHTFWIHETIKISNLTVHSIDTKYCVHQDQESDCFDSLFENCNFIKEIRNSQEWRVLGLGTRHNQTARFRNCTGRFINNSKFTTNTGPMMMFWHNLDNQKSGTTLEMINCKAIDCGIGLFFDLGSNQNDKVVINNCSTNSIHHGIAIENHPSNTSNSYNITFDISNSNIPFYELRPGAGGRENINLVSLAINDYHIPFANKNSKELKRGYAVQIDKNGDISLSENNLNFSGVVWRDVNTGNNGYYTPKGKIAQVLIDQDVKAGNNGAPTTKGLFTNSSASEAVGTFLTDAKAFHFVKIKLFN